MSLAARGDHPITGRDTKTYASAGTALGQTFAPLPSPSASAPEGHSAGMFEFCSGLVDLVVGVHHHRGGGHRLTLAGERFVGLVTEHFAEVGDRGAELGDCRRGDGTECETGDGGCRFDASEAVEEYRESCQGATDVGDVARVVAVADDQSDVIERRQRVTVLSLKPRQNVGQVGFVQAVAAVLGDHQAPAQGLEPDPAVFEEESAPAPPAGKRTFAEWLENLWILNVLIFAAGITYFVLSGFQLNISSMVMLFTVTSALLHGTPIRFIRAFSGAAKVSGPLLLQYPLYGGIVGLLGYLPPKAGGASGKPLQTVLAEALVSGANEYTLPFLTFIGSVIISLFVPSGGGHWAVQGPVAVDSALALHQHSPAYLGLISMSVAVGEGVANMIQPFWLLPLLAIAKPNVRQVMGLTIIAFLIGLVVTSATVPIAPHVL
jgi:hypothetical protein